MSDADTATSGLAGGMAKPTGRTMPAAAPTQTPATAAGPTNAVGPFRLPGIGGIPGGMNPPRLTPRMEPIVPGAELLLRRQDEEGYA